MQAYYKFGQFDGFWDATRAIVTLPADVPFDQLKACPNCVAPRLSLVPADYLAELEKTVIEPVKRVQTLIDSHPEITRMYTTLSADEMTLDPLFTFNPDLPAVSNQHVAERIVECNPNVTFSQAPWRIELPQGGVIRGIGAAGTWPAALANLPPNRSIVRAAASGAGKVLEDNSADIAAQLDAYNGVSQATAGVAGAIGVAGQGTGGAAAMGRGGGTAMGSGAGTTAAAGAGSGVAGGGVSAGPGGAAGGGCSLARNESPLFALFTAGALGAMVARRRRRR